MNMLKTASIGLVAALMFGATGVVSAHDGGRWRDGHGWGHHHHHFHHGYWGGPVVVAPPVRYYSPAYVVRRAPAPVYYEPAYYYAPPPGITISLPPVSIGIR